MQQQGNLCMQTTWLSSQPAEVMMCLCCVCEPWLWSGRTCPALELRRLLCKLDRAVLSVKNNQYTHIKY